MTVLAILEWRLVLGDIGAVFAVFVIVASTVRWVFGPRLAAWATGLLRPVEDQIEALSERNTAEHLVTGQRFDELEEKIGEQWQAHNEKHDEIQRSLGRIEGRQAG